MFGMGMGELVVILIVALLFIGPDKLPDAAKAIGKGMRELRRQTKGLQNTLEQDEDLASTVREIKSALRGDDDVPSIRPPAQTGIGRIPAAKTMEPMPAEPAPPAPEGATKAPEHAPPTATAPESKDPTGNG
jgi:Tat protein translocase TatB subunit